MTEERIDKLYETINSKYLTKDSIDRETVNAITQRLGEIDRMYYDNIIADKNKNPKFEHTYFNSCFVWKILNNDKLDEAATKPAIITLIGAAYIWGAKFDKTPGEELFKDGTYKCLLNPTTTYDLPSTQPYTREEREINKRKLGTERTSKTNSPVDLAFWNDGNLTKYINRFLAITDEEIIQKMKEYVAKKE